MNKHITYLENITKGLDEHSAHNGKNKSIRNTESSKILHAVDLLNNYLNKNPDLAELLLEYHGGNQFGYDETLSFKYIVRDVERLIIFLKEKDEANDEKLD